MMYDAAQRNRIDVPNFICAQCGEGFHNLGSLDIHMETHEALRHVDGTPSLRTIVPPDVGKVGVCEICWTPLPMRPGSVWPQKCEACCGKKKRVVYISGPYRAPTETGVYENIQVARSAAMKYWRLGYAVFCPHLNTAFMGGLGGSPETDQEMFISGDLEFVRRSDIIVMLPRWADSKGALQELAEARRFGKEVVWES